MRKLTHFSTLTVVVYFIIASSGACAAYVEGAVSPLDGMLKFDTVTEGKSEVEIRLTGSKTAHFGLAF